MDNNIYQAPASDITTNESDATQPVKLFNAKGRMGRIRYMFYTIALPMGIYLLLSFLMAFLIPIFYESSFPAFNMIFPIMIGLLAIFWLVAQIFATIQRCHDFNVTGWLTLVIILPIAVLFFWFIPGSKYENSYGVKPEKNKWFHYAGLIVIPMVIAILAAIAIPAYQDYVERSKAAQISSQG